MEIRDIESNHAHLDAVYDGLLARSFSADELVDRAEFHESASDGLLWVTAAVEDGIPVGAAVAEWSPASRVLLLSYLAVRADSRCNGIGSRLMSTVRTRWQEHVHPKLTLVELEHPAVHRGDSMRGDPLRRLRFYARHGTRALALPYFQPALRPEASRVRGMVLGLVAAAPGLADTDEVVSEPVRTFMIEYLEQSEGTAYPAEDQEVAALLGAMADETIALLPVDAPALMPPLGRFGGGPGTRRV